MLRFIIGLALIAFLNLPAALKAQNINPYWETLNSYNRIKPLQNPRWERASRILKDNITDRKNRVVGDIQNVLINSKGKIETITADLRRLRLGGDIPLGVDELNIKPTSRGFSSQFNKEQIENFVPQILAGIQTASGQDSNMISVENLKGARVKSSDGRKLGKVEEIMFSKTNTMASALVIDVRYKMIGGERVAIPFKDAHVKPAGRGYEITIDKDKSDAILAFAEERN